MSFMNETSKQVKTGRRILYTSLNDNEVNDFENVRKVLQDVIPLQEKNAVECKQLRESYLGEQNILEKKNTIREEINNIVVENNLFNFVEFKKGFVFGKPISFVADNQDKTEMVEELNKYYQELDKSTVDIDTAEEMYVCGTAYKITLPNLDKSMDSPFTTHLLNGEDAFVVYSTDYSKKPMFCGYITRMIDYSKNPTVKYNLVTIYTKKKVFRYRYESYISEKDWIEYVLPKDIEHENNGIQMLPIVEYPLNKSRIGIIEIVEPLTDAMNILTSSTLDDIEQFIQSLLVFTNADLDTETYTKMYEKGVIMLKSNTMGLTSKVDVITKTLDYAGIQSKHNDLYSKALSIVGVPRMSESGSRGDTGEAKEIGEGWRIAGERAKQDELSFKKAEKSTLLLQLSIANTKNKLKGLVLSDIEIRFNRNQSDNLLVKTQALSSLLSSGVTCEDALNVVGLFNSPSEVASRMEEQRLTRIEENKQMIEDSKNTEGKEKPIIDNKPRPKDKV